VLLFPLIAARKAIKNISIIGSMLCCWWKASVLASALAFLISITIIFLLARVVCQQLSGSDEIYGLISNASARRLHFN
jgi:hypothetical protein